jgi:hypothetical protein
MPLTPGQRRLYSGDYNYMSQEWQPDGSVIVTISGGRSDQVHRMHVRDLWGQREEVLTEQIIPQNIPPHVAARFAELKEVPDAQEQP